MNHSGTGRSSEHALARQPIFWLGVLLAVGFVLRLWAMRWPPLPYDMNAWIAWGERVLAVGPREFYDPDVFTDYAPGYIYVLWFTAAIKHAFFPDAGVGVYHALYRLPPIICDLLTTALIYNVLHRLVVSRQQSAVSNQRSAFIVYRFEAWLPLIGAGVHLFNPLVIFNSAIWGQIDSTFTFALLLALVLALRGYVGAAALTYVVAFMIKPQAIALLPVLVVLIVMRYSWRRWLPAGIAAIVLGFVVIAPFLGWRSYLALAELLGGSVNVYPYTSMFTYNLWGIFGFWEDDRVSSILGLSLRSTGTLLYLIGIGYGVWIFWRALRHARDPLFASLAAATYFLFLPVMVLTRMHERYLYPIFPFLLIVALLGVMNYGYERRAGPLRWMPLALYGFLSVLHTFNLYQVYLYYIYFNDDLRVPESNTLYYFIERNGALWSALTLAAFVVIAVALWWWSMPPREQRARQETRLADQTK